VLIARCAWHRTYYGRPAWGGVLSWRGLGLRFSDGICPRCLARLREEHDRLRQRPSPERLGRTA